MIPSVPPTLKKEEQEQIEVRVDESSSPTYTLHRWRFVGVIGLVILNIAAGLNWPWFSAISTQTTKDFHISVTQVNWLGNAINIIFMPASLVVPILCRRYGLRACCFIGATLLALAGWVRFAGTASHLNPQGAYALLFLGQLIAGAAQPIFQVLGPKYSQAWFNFNGRTTATMVIAISNPIGAALGQLLPPILGKTRFTILVLAIVSTVVFPAAFLIHSQPPTPPTFSGSRSSPPSISTIRSLLNRTQEGDRYFSLRTRLDFVILAFGFASFVAAANAFGLLTAQLFEPFGYTASESGLFGATLILAGLFGAIVSAPLFDRVLTRHITLSVKILTPFLAISWLSLIWAVRGKNFGALFAIMAVDGITSLTLLPLSLELACEISGDAETSSAILWFCANLLGIVFVLVEDALKAGANGSPPYNLRKSSTFVAVFCCFAAALFVVFFRGLMDTRRSLDAAKEREAMQTERDKKVETV